MPAHRSHQHVFETIADNLPQMIWVADLGGSAEYHSKQFQDYTGRSREATCGEGWAALVHPDDLPGLAAAWGRAVGNREPFEAEHRIRRHDGVYRWFLGRAVTRNGPDGVVRWFGTLTDIEDRKNAEEVLRLRDRAIRAVAQGVVIADATRPDHPLVFVSSGFEQTTGYRADEALGRNCRFLQGEGTDPAAVARVRAAVRAGEPCVVELLNYTKDHRPFWNELSISPVRNDAGRVTHLVGVLADVTARRLLEAQFRQAQKMEALGRLAGGVAHDFNNLLTVISGYSKLLLDDGGAEVEWREPVSEIYNAGRRAADLTRQLLAFSRQSVLEPRVFDPNTLVAGAEKLLRRLIGEDVGLLARLDPTAGRILADPGQLEQALVNLAVNARDAMPTGGEVTVGTRNVDVDGERPDVAPGQYVAVSVADTGHGMDSATQARIFEPFFTTKGPGQGTGLGLPMVYGFVRQSGGFVEVSSAPGCGSRFELFLPRVETAAAAPPAALPLPVPAGTETILLVEDDAAVRTFAGHVLRGSGYTVLESSNGPDATRLAAAHDGPIALVMTDVVMPGMGGSKVAEAVRAAHPGARVLYVSGYTDDALARHGVAAGQVNFLRKPFTPATLSLKIREVLDR